MAKPNKGGGNTPTPTQAPSTPPATPASGGQEPSVKWNPIIGMLLVIVGILIIASMVRGCDGPKTSASMAMGNTGRPMPLPADAIDMRVTPHVVDRDVTTNWYDPNTQGLHVSILGWPVGNPGKQWHWQMRVNHDDATIMEMTANDGGQDPAGYQSTNNVAIQCIEYRITPGQETTRSTFRFRFDPPQ